MTTRLSDSRLRAWRGLLNAQSAAVRGISQFLGDHGGLALESYDVLYELYRAPDHRLRLRDLGERVVLTRSGISRLVSRLEKEGLVERAKVSGDARGVYAALTESGEAAFRTTWPLYAQAIDRYFARHISDAEADALADVLERIRSADGSEDGR